MRLSRRQETMRCACVRVPSTALTQCCLAAQLERKRWLPRVVVYYEPRIVPRPRNKKKLCEINNKQANNIQNNVYVTADLTKLLKGNAKDFLNKETREVIDVESEDVRKRQE